MRPGYLFLMSVIIVGAIASAATASLLLLSLGGERNVSARHMGLQAMSNAHACAERALNSLQSDLGYSGDESVNLNSGTCRTLAVGGVGNTDRSICVSGTAFEIYTSRIEILISEVLPEVKVTSWQEVESFSSCTD